MSIDKLKEEWAADAEKLLLGKKIVAVRYMTDEEVLEIGWNKAPIVLQLDDGNIIFPSMDDEGNDAGALFTNDAKLPTIPTI